MDLSPWHKAYAYSSPNVSKRTSRHASTSKRSKGMDTSLCLATARTFTRRLASSVVVFIGILQQPTWAQETLTFLNPGRIPEGGRVEIATPDGLDCRSLQSDRPSLNVGGGITKPSVLPGMSSGDAFEATRLGPPEPLAGVSIIIPFGGEQRNCDRIIEMEEATLRVRKAQELYDLGVINEDEFRSVGRKAYDVLMN